MRRSIKKEFAGAKPRAIVLDDSATSRLMTARRLRKRGFEVIPCESAKKFQELWRPGTVDVIVADWQLSNKASEHGDRMLAKVRERDWDVPFVLVSGKLDEDLGRAKVLQRLLESGGARFVRRGSDSIERACADAEDLIERRDLALLKIVLSLRKGAMAGAKIQTSSGEKAIADLLEELVSKPKYSHDAGRPIAERRSARATAGGVESAR